MSKGKVIDFPKKQPAIPAMDQLQMANLQKKVDSIVPLISQTYTNVLKQVRTVEGEARAALIRTDALINLLKSKEVFKEEEFQQEIANISAQFEKLEEFQYEMQNNLEPSTDAVKVTDHVLIKFSAKDKSNDVWVEQDQKVMLQVDESLYSFTQIREVIKSLVGKNVGDKETLDIDIAATEVDNPFKGLSIQFSYEILKVKKCKAPAEQAPEVVPPVTH